MQNPDSLRQDFVVQWVKMMYRQKLKKGGRIKMISEVIKLYEDRNDVTLTTYILQDSPQL